MKNVGDGTVNVDTEDGSTAPFSSFFLEEQESIREWLKEKYGVLLGKNKCEDL